MRDRDLIPSTMDGDIALDATVYDSLLENRFFLDALNKRGYIVFNWGIDIHRVTKNNKVEKLSAHPNQCKHPSRN